MRNSRCFLAESWYNAYHQLAKGGRAAGVAATLVNWHTVRQCCYQMSWGLLAPDVLPSLLGGTGTIAYQLRLLNKKGKDSNTRVLFPDKGDTSTPKLEPMAVRSFGGFVLENRSVSRELQDQLFVVASPFFKARMQYLRP